MEDELHSEKEGRTQMDRPQRKKTERQRKDRNGRVPVQDNIRREMPFIVLVGVSRCSKAAAKTSTTVNAVWVCAPKSNSVPVGMCLYLRGGVADFDIVSELGCRDGACASSVKYFRCTKARQLAVCLFLGCMSAVNFRGRLATFLEHTSKKVSGAGSPPDSTKKGRQLKERSDTTQIVYTLLHFCKTGGHIRLRRFS